jgi:hypothetical protein
VVVQLAALRAARACCHRACLHVWRTAVLVLFLPFSVPVPGPAPALSQSFTRPSQAWPPLLPTLQALMPPSP